MAMEDSIILSGASVYNLKHIDVESRRNKLVVVTGLSGSGKSSLAFDTLYAEGQRRYVESLSSYARQFLGRMSKPECDYMRGLPPAIAIEQKVTSRNPRSTVGTSTEIYEYLRLLFARIGHTISPISGEEVKRHSVEDIVRYAQEQPVGRRFLVMAPLLLRGGRTRMEQLVEHLRMGYTRLEVNGEVVRLEEYKGEEGDTIYLLIDRLTTGGDDSSALSRLTDSVETALAEGDGTCFLRFLPEGELLTFSTRFEADGITFEPPTDQLFSFNSPIGACPECEGFGKVLGIDEHLVVPNRHLSVYDGAVVCWRGDQMNEWRAAFIAEAAAATFPIFRPYYQLTQAQRDFLWHGPREKTCIDSFFKMVEENQYKIQYRVMLSRYRGKTACPRCHGTRLKKEANYVYVGEKNISELVELSIVELKTFFEQLALPDHEQKVAQRLLTEINNRLQFLLDVGLGYLTLNRPSNTLSGGESQRINLATSLGSSLVGSLYILDEPSIGLHSRDTQRLIKVLRQLQQLGNTVVVVEHDEEIIREADYIIDIGPEAGQMGGEVVYQGAMNNLQRGTRSYTLQYLLGEDEIAVPKFRRKWNNYITVKGARENNLQGIDVKFPLNVMTVVTGVSGSGKSTLVRDIFYRALKRMYSELSERPGEHIAIEGDTHLVKEIQFVDQHPIGKSSRSNPATYLKAYEEIRKLFAEQQLAQQMGYSPSFFSFNNEG